MNPSQYPKEIYNLLYTDETGEVVGLDEVQYLEPTPLERVSPLIELLSNEDAYLAYQCGLILAAWGIKEGVDYLRHLVETRITQVADYSPAWLNVWAKMKRAIFRANPAAVTA